MNHIRSVLLLTLVLLAGCGTSSRSTLPAATPPLQIASSVPVTKPMMLSAASTPVAPVPHPELLTSVPKPAQPATGTSRVLYTRSFSEQAHDSQTRSEFWSITVNGSDNHKLFACPAGCWIEGFAVASNSEWIAYSAVLRDGPAQLHVAHLDGTDDHIVLDRLTPPPQWGASYTFAPDGTRIAFVQSRSLPVAGEEASVWIVATRGGEPQQMSDWGASIGTPYWSDNTHLLYTDGVIRRVSVQGSLAAETVFQGRIAGLSADRTTLLTWLEPTDSDIGDSDRPSTFGIVTLEESESRLVKKVRFPIQPFAWSPDATMIAQTIGGNVELIRWQDDTHAILTHYQPDRHQHTKAQDDGVLGTVAWTRDNTGLLYRVGQPDTPGTVRLQYYNLTNNSEQTLIEQFGGTFVVTPYEAT